MKVIQLFFTFALCFPANLYSNNQDADDRYRSIFIVHSSFRNTLHNNGNGGDVNQDFTNFLVEMKKQKKLSRLFKLRAELGAIGQAITGREIKT